MTEATLTSEFIIRWMSFQEYGDQITKLRRRVYIEEQGFGEDVVSSPHDAEGLHLGAFYDGELVSAISAYVYPPKSDALEELGLPPAQERVVQFAKRVELPEHRKRRLGELLATTIWRVVYETIRPQYVFLVLRGIHIEMQSHYNRIFGFEYHTTIPAPGGEQVIMMTPNDRRLKQAYLKVRKANEAAMASQNIRPPSLVPHLERQGWTDQIALGKLKLDNLYMAPLSLKDELPRLSAQTRVLYGEQQRRLNDVNFPPPPAKLLDVGAGPGVYLAMLGRQPKLSGYELVGLDQSPEMVMYARLNHPKIRWIQASVYDTGEPDASYDVVHANFLFIHLLSPALALRELNRILKPGGILYVLDVNDSTFEGPESIAHMIRLHHELYEGDRNVMNSLPHLAKEHRFTIDQQFTTRVRNTATEVELMFTESEILLDRNKFWGLFSFLGQREELAEQFKAAQELYFGSNCEISICIQTHVYRKVD